MTHAESIKNLYGKHWRKLYVHACNLLNDSELAKDVVNDVFCSALENAARLHDAPNPLPLLFVMVRNRCIDHLRHRSVVCKFQKNYARELYAEWTEKDYEAYEEQISRMQESIRNMSPQMRTVVEAYFLSAKKCSEISEQLNISDNTVRTHIARAMKLLRKQLISIFILLAFFVSDLVLAD